MKLDFKILWFEDQFKELASQLEEIQEHIRDAGFQPGIIQQPDGEQIEDLARQQQLYNEFELVVVDLNLAGEWLGDDVAAQIRANFSFTDILFYSGDGEAELRRRIADKGVDGIYCCDRSDIVQKVIERVEFVRGSLDRLESMRGLVASVVGQCDRLLIEVVAAHDGVLLATDELEGILDTLVQDSFGRARSGYEACSTINQRLESRSVTSHVLWAAVRKLIQKDGPQKKERGVLKGYGSEILEKRNVLSHVVETKGADGWEVSDTKGGTFTREDYPKLRRDLSIHLTNLRSLHAGIDTQIKGK